MAYQTLPHQDRHAIETDIAVTYATLSAQFGDGYEQTAAAGINNKQKVWSVTYTALDETTFAEVANFLDSVGGHMPFYATPTGEEEQLWRLVPNSLKISVLAINKTDGQVWRSIRFDAKKAYL